MDYKEGYLLYSLSSPDLLPSQYGFCQVWLGPASNKHFHYYINKMTMNTSCLFVINDLRWLPDLKL